MNSAILSPCGTYRYVLTRDILDPFFSWRVNRGLFVMLNPSTADASVDDPTIRRCIGFARREGWTRLTVVNLFGLRATDPKELLTNPSPYGENFDHLVAQIRSHVGSVVAAWGTNPAVKRCIDLAYVRQVLSESDVRCLGTTKDGSPRHPLYVAADQPLVPWKAPT